MSVPLIENWNVTADASRRVNSGVRLLMTLDVTDIWFRSKLPLAEIARRLDLREVTEDAEDHWAWVIGTLGEVKLDISRTHTLPAGHAETRIFVLGDGRFSESLIAKVVARLREFVSGPIACGRWQYRSGNDFDLVLVREFTPDDAA